MRIVVEKLKEETHEYEVGAADTIESLQSTIHERLGLEPSRQILVQGRKQLTDIGASFQSLGIEDGAKLLLLEKAQGVTSAEVGDSWEPEDEKGTLKGESRSDYTRFASGTIAITENCDYLYRGAKSITSGSGVHAWSLRVEWESGWVIIGAQSEQWRSSPEKHSCTGMPYKDGSPLALNEWDFEDLLDAFGSMEPKFHFKPGDTVDVTLDLNRKQLSFKTNGEDNGVTYDNIDDGPWQIYSKVRTSRGITTVEILSYSEQP